LVSLIRHLSRANSLWGAPRIHGELRKLGIGFAQGTVAKYMLSGSRRPSSETWTTFLRNHLGPMASVDFCTVPTFNFRLLDVFLVLAHQRRQVLHFNLVEEPSAGRLISGHPRPVLAIRSLRPGRKHHQTISPSFSAKLRHRLSPRAVPNIG
jgi:hypothetical protein